MNHSKEIKLFLVNWSLFVSGHEAIQLILRYLYYSRHC